MWPFWHWVHVRTKLSTADIEYKRWKGKLFSRSIAKAKRFAPLTHSSIVCYVWVNGTYTIYMARMYTVSVWLWLHRHMYSIYYTYIFDSMIYWLAPLSYWASFCHNGQCCLFLSERRSFVFRFLFVTYWRKQWLIIIRVYYSVYWSVNILYRRFVFSHSVCALR